MNLRLVVKNLGQLLLMLSVLMAVALIAEAFGFGTPLVVLGPDADGGVPALNAGAASAVPAFSIALLFNVILGGAMVFIGSRGTSEQFGRRDSMLLVGVAWIVGAATSALPYYLWAVLREPVVGAPPHPFESYAMAFFESVSGLTTTGATILGAVPNDIESLPGGLLLWRSAQQWFGGLGIVVLFVAVLPNIAAAGGKKLVNIESTGTGPAVRPRIREAVRVLWFIYLTFSVSCFGLLWLAGMSVFDAVCHAGTAVASGGYSPRNASIGAYHDLGPGSAAAIEWILILFMTMAGINFGLFYAAVNNRWRTVWRDSELRVYLGMMAVITLVIGLFLMDAEPILTSGEQIQAGLLDRIRLAAFSTVSLQTSTGYASHDFDLLPFSGKAMLCIAMFAGGCAGSTGGGLKVVRVLTLLKVAWAELERAFRPSVVRPIRVNRMVIDAEQQRGVVVFAVLVVLILVACSILLRIFEQGAGLDITTTATAAIATLMNTGPGFHAVGPTQNFAFFSSPSLYLLSLMMVLGRLELFALLVFLVPRFWRGN